MLLFLFIELIKSDWVLIKFWLSCFIVLQQRKALPCFNWSCYIYEMSSFAWCTLHSNRIGFFFQNLNSIYTNGWLSKNGSKLLLGWKLLIEIAHIMFQSLKTNKERMKKKNYPFKDLTVFYMYTSIIHYSAVFILNECRKCWGVYFDHNFFHYHGDFQIYQ